MLEIYENDKKSNVSEWVTRFKKGKKVIWTWGKFWETVK